MDKDIITLSKDDVFIVKKDRILTDEEAIYMRDMFKKVGIYKLLIFDDGKNFQIIRVTEG